MAVDQERVEQARKALERVANSWVGRPGVVSVEVARRWQGGAPTDEVAIRVMVERKRPPDEVPEGELFPPALDGIPVEVVEGSAPRPES